MEQLAARSFAAMGPPPAMLRLRHAGKGDHGALSSDAPWSPFCMLVPGHHSVGEKKKRIACMQLQLTAAIHLARNAAECHHLFPQFQSCSMLLPTGDWQVQICKHPGTLSVTVRDCSEPPGQPDPQQALPKPFACDVAIDSLQLDLWDDERQRLCGGRVSPGVNDTTTASAKHSSRVASTAQKCGQQQLGRRLFSISIDGLGLTALQRHTAGTQTPHYARSTLD